MADRQSGAPPSYSLLKWLGAFLGVITATITVVTQLPKARTALRELLDSSASAAGPTITDDRPFTVNGPGPSSAPITVAAPEDIHDRLHELNRLGAEAMYAGDFPTARKYLRQAIALPGVERDKYYRFAHDNMGYAALLEGDLGQADAWASRGLALVRQSGLTNHPLTRVIEMKRSCDADPAQCFAYGVRFRNDYKGRLDEGKDASAYRREALAAFRRGCDANDARSCDAAQGKW